MNRCLQRDDPSRHEHDASSFTRGKKARFYRGFFENRFKQRKTSGAVVAVALPFYESECQERTSSRQSAQQKLLWHSALTLDGARQSGPNAGVGSTTSFLA